MRKILLSLVLSSLFSNCLIGQSSIVITRVLDRIDLESNTLFNTQQSKITISLIERVFNFDTSLVVGVYVGNANNIKIGSSNSIALSSGFNVGIGSSSISQLVLKEEYVELDTGDFYELYDFINFSMARANPMQKMEVAYTLVMDDGMALALVFNGDTWYYNFIIKDANYAVDFSQSIEIIKKFKEFKLVLNN